MMMNKPKIRFSGYTEAWEQRKLGELSSSFEYGLNAAAKEYDGENKYIRITDIDDDSREFKQEDITSPDTDLSSAENYRLSEGDILFARTGASVGKSYIYKVSDGLVYYAGFLIRARIKPEYNSEFVFQNTLTSDYEKFIKVTSMRSGQPGVNAQEYSQYQIMVPSKPEQDKISECLRNLDHLITLHQRKCDQTKKLKKYMLQKMFPQNGELYPEIRFEGFTNAWEQRKVTDLGEIYIGLVTTMTEHYTDKGNLLIRNSDIKDGYFEFGENPIYLDEEFSEQNKSRMHQLGDVITVHTGDIGTSAVIGKNEVNSIGFATIVTRPNQEILDSNYFATYLNTDTHKQWAISMATGDGRSNYNLKDYTKLIVPVPQIEEQKKIASCICNLNNLITLHQRKCNELKEMKKYMLQNMFAV